MPNWREELAWAAGFFDGEGTTHGGKRSDRYNGTMISMSVPQVKLLPLERFHSAVLGQGKIFLRNRAKPNVQACYVWQAQNWRSVQAVSSMLWEFLSNIKKEQYLIALENFRSNPDWGRKIGRPLGSKNRPKMETQYAN